jgi:hypothetical protein
VRRSLLVLLGVVAAAFPSAAAAAPVLVLGRDGRATVRNDPFVTGPAVTPAPAGSSASPDAIVAAARKPKKRPPVTFLSELARLYHSGALTAAQ